MVPQHLDYLEIEDHPRDAEGAPFTLVAITTTARSTLFRGTRGERPGVCRSLELFFDVEQSAINRYLDCGPGTGLGVWRDGGAGMGAFTGAPHFRPAFQPFVRDLTPGDVAPLRDDLEVTQLRDETAYTLLALDSGRPANYTCFVRRPHNEITWHHPPAELQHPTLGVATARLFSVPEAFLCFRPLEGQRPFVGRSHALVPTFRAAAGTTSKSDFYASGLDRGARLEEPKVGARVALGTLPYRKIRSGAHCTTSVPSVSSSTFLMSQSSRV
jgi:hypothetical protein